MIISNTISLQKNLNFMNVWFESTKSLTFNNLINYINDLMFCLIRNVNLEQVKKNTQKKNAAKFLKQNHKSAALHQLVLKIYILNTSCTLALFVVFVLKITKPYFHFQIISKSAYIFRPYTEAQKVPWGGGRGGGGANFQCALQVTHSDRANTQINCLFLVM